MLPTVTYAQAVALKEKGFDEKCESFYQVGYEAVRHVLPTQNWNWFNDYLNAPDLYTVCDWLRDKHDLHLSVRAIGKWYDCMIQGTKDGEELYDTGAGTTHDLALSAAITHALTLIQ